MKDIKITIQFPNDETRMDFETWFLDLHGCSDFNAHQERGGRPLLKFNTSAEEGSFVWTAQTLIF